MANQQRNILLEATNDENKPIGWGYFNFAGVFKLPARREQ